MLELGQPLHAFDACTIKGGIRVRYARPGETWPLLNGETPTFDPSYLVIADEEKAVALAGIMGGSPTAVSDATRDVFLESAFFSPEAIAGNRARSASVPIRRSDSSAVWISEIAARNRLRDASRAKIRGGQSGPVSEALAMLPARPPVRLRLDRVERVLGIGFDAERAATILRSLGFDVAWGTVLLEVTSPSYRFDIAIEEDLIEESASMATTTSRRPRRSRTQAWWARGVAAFAGSASHATRGSRLSRSGDVQLHRSRMGAGLLRQRTADRARESDRKSHERHAIESDTGSRRDHRIERAPQAGARALFEIGCC